MRTSSMFVLYSIDCGDDDDDATRRTRMPFFGQ